MEGVESSGFARVLGDELRRARLRHKWVRRDVLDQLPWEVSLQTVATWELGTRSVSVARFVDLCRVLEVAAPELLSRALDRIAESGGVRINLADAARDRRRELEPLRRWARSRLDASPSGLLTVRLAPAAIEQLAVLCGMHGTELLAALTQPLDRS